MPALNLPPETLYTIDPGYSGAAAWGVQRGLNRSRVFDTNLLTDGWYGEKTETRVAKFQSRLGLEPDGRFGPATSLALSHRLQDFAVGELVLPDRITYSLVGLESGDLIGAVNWSVAGGVDLSYAQRRVFGPPFAEAAIQRAFDGYYQFKLLAKQLRERHDAFHGRAGSQSQEASWRQAALAHNYPYAAEQYSLNRWPSVYALSPQPWVEVHGLKFPDGEAVRTPHEWCCRYSLGDPDHNEPGQAVKDVTDWNTP